MAKKLLKRITPHQSTVEKSKAFRALGPWLGNPNLWHLNRHSAANAVSVALFCGFIPLPGHMIFCMILSILIRCNLPLTIVLVWYSNPFTMPALFYFAYKIGLIALHLPPIPFEFHLSMHWIIHELETIWRPFLLGCFLCGLSIALLGNVIVRILWRLQVVRHWKQRASTRKKNARSY